jgi:hypothetical protein
MRAGNSDALADDRGRLAGRLGSLRRFNAMFSEVYERSPGVIRRRCPAKSPMTGQPRPVRQTTVERSGLKCPATLDIRWQSGQRGCRTGKRTKHRGERRLRGQRERHRLGERHSSRRNTAISFGLTTASFRRWRTMVGVAPNRAAIVSGPSPFVIQLFEGVELVSRVHGFAGDVLREADLRQRRIIGRPHIARHQIIRRYLLLLQQQPQRVEPCAADEDTNFPTWVGCTRKFCRMVLSGLAPS